MHLPRRVARAGGGAGWDDAVDLGEVFGAQSEIGSAHIFLKMFSRFCAGDWHDECAEARAHFRLGEEPNIRVGVAMITSAPEALALHEKMARDLWASALKGPAAVRFMRAMMEKLTGG